MPYIHDYEIYIFDCDGVILDSNNMKIEAMKVALAKINISPEKVESCIEYFSNNFGKSRFHHINYFLEEIVRVENDQYQSFYNIVLSEYAEQCKNSYSMSPICDGFVDFVSAIDGKKYVASGTDEVELRTTLLEKDLKKYFMGIFGSPKRKVAIVENIIANCKGKRAIMFGDAIADLEAALENDIDFIACRKYSNTPVRLEERARMHNFPVINTFRDLL